MKAELKPLPPRDAIAALLARGTSLDPSFSWLDVWQEEHARAFTVAKSAGFDVLGDIHAALLKALSEGRTFRDFASDLRPVLEDKGWWGRRLVTDPETGEEQAAMLGSPRRLATIFDVNMRVSYAAGHWAMFERNKARRPFLRYVHVDPELHQPNSRPHHARLHNLVLPVDHPFWQRFAPPNGWGCRCTLQQLSQRDVDRLIAQGEDLHFEPPEIVERPFVNRRTGEVIAVPEGIDPGWDYNPGLAGHRAAVLADKLVGAPPDLAAAATADPHWPREALADEFAAWVDRLERGQPVDRSMFTVGALEPRLLEALADRGIQPQTAAITVRQADIGHALRDIKAEAGKAAPVESLRRLPQTIMEADAILRDRRDGALIYVFALEESRRGKLVVRLDYSQRVREPGEKRRQIVTNAFRTAGVVDVEDLLATTVYELLVGRLR